jgi:hypothetical protein
MLSQESAQGMLIRKGVTAAFALDDTPTEKVRYRPLKKNITFPCNSEGINHPRSLKGENEWK